MAITILNSENIQLFNQLRIIRDDSVHFHTQIDNGAKDFALKSIKYVIQIITNQYGLEGKNLGNGYLFYDPSDSAYYIKDEYRLDHYVQKIIKPYSQLVSFKHKVLNMNNNGKLLIEDNNKFRKYVNIKDNDFLKRRK